MNFGSLAFNSSTAEFPNPPDRPFFIFLGALFTSWLTILICVRSSLRFCSLVETVVYFVLGAVHNALFYLSLILFLTSLHFTL